MKVSLFAFGHVVHKIQQLVVEAIQIVAAWQLVATFLIPLHAGMYCKMQTPWKLMRLSKIPVCGDRLKGAVQCAAQSLTQAGLSSSAWTQDTDHNNLSLPTSLTSAEAAWYTLPRFRHCHARA
jgi:hypothetical protein